MVLSWIREKRVDGLIIAKPGKRERPLLQKAIEHQIPVVSVAPDEVVKKIQVVRCNNIAAGPAVAAHLAGLRHRKIGYAGGPRRSPGSQHRLAGMRKRLKQLGIPLA